MKIFECPTVSRLFYDSYKINCCNRVACLFNRMLSVAERVGQCHCRVSRREGIALNKGLYQFYDSKTCQVLKCNFLRSPCTRVKINYKLNFKSVTSHWFFSLLLYKNILRFEIHNVECCIFFPKALYCRCIDYGLITRYVTLCIIFLYTYLNSSFLYHKKLSNSIWGF